MMRRFGLAVIALFGLAWAAPSAEPALEVRIQSINGLLDHFEYLGDLVNQAEPAKQAAALVQAFTHPKKGLEGIDPTRPIGAYVIVTPSVVDSQIVGLLPISDSEAFLAMLQDKLRLTPQETDGLYELKIPNVPVPMFFRFADGYLHATAIRSAGIDPEKLIKPAVFFSQKQSSILSIQAHVDRVPKTLKQTVFGQLELRIEEAKARKEPGLSATQMKLRNLGWDLFADATKTWFDEGKQLRMDLMVEPQSDTLRIALDITARSRSNLSQAFVGAATPSLAAALAHQEKHPTLAGYLQVALPKRYQARIAEIVDLFAEEVVQKARPEAREVTRITWDAIAPTLKSGVLELGLLVTGPTKDRTIGLTTVIWSPNTRKVDEAVRVLANKIPAEIIAFDLSDKAEQGATIHTLNLPQSAALQPIFGSQSVWLGTTQNMILLGMGKSPSPLAQAATLPPQKATLVGWVLSVSRLVAVFEKQLKPEQIAEIVHTVFGEKPQPDVDEVRFEAQAGNPLQLRFSVKGRAIKFTAALDRARKTATAESPSANP